MIDSIQAHSNPNALSEADLIEGFTQLGLKPGDVVLMHSAMRTLGPVDSGAQTVVDALKQVIGPRGTLVTPTFTFAHEAEDDPVIAPRSDRSEMGSISEAVRLQPDAQRSVAFRHSFAATGRRAQVITQVDPALSPFDLRSAFGVMLGLNTQVILLGVTYTSSTSHHFAEMVCEVPYRQTIAKRVKMRSEDGSERLQDMIDYQPKGTADSYHGRRKPDFNRLGTMLEDAGRVSTAFIGNAAVRRFAMRDLIDLAQVEAERDYNIFRTREDQPGVLTELTFGQCAWSPQFADGAGRPNRVQWCARDLKQLTMPKWPSE